MRGTDKYNRILDALQTLLEEKRIQNISVSEIAQKAEIGKGSVYYYFSSKEAILDALVKRNYEQPLETAKKLASRTDIAPHLRMAMIFQACRSSSAAFLKQNDSTGAQAKSFLHQKYLNHLISELKPTLTEIIRQGIEGGDIDFDNPEALSEIVLIVIAVKMDNSLVPSNAEEIENTLKGLITLLEKGTGVPKGTLSYLSCIE